MVSKKLRACKHSGIILPTNGSTLLQTTKQSHNKHHQGSFTGDNETKKSSWPHFTYSVRKCMHCVCHHGEEREIHIWVENAFCYHSMFIQSTFKKCAESEHLNCSNINKSVYITAGCSLCTTDHHLTSSRNPQEGLGVLLCCPDWSIQTSLTLGTDLSLTQ